MSNRLEHPDDISEVPFNAIVRFKTFRGRWFIRSRRPAFSTGFFISPNHILTAGHNFYTKYTNVVDSYASIAEHKGDRILEIENFHQSKNAFVSPAFNSWRRFRTRQRDDYCVVKLDQQVETKSLFSLPEIGSTRLLKGTPVWVGGYPLINGDPNFNGNDMHWGSGKILSFSNNGSTFTYDVDTAGGNSGGPVWIRNDEGEFVAVGIHIGQGSPNTLGVARTIDSEVISFVQNYGYTYN